MLILFLDTEFTSLNKECQLISLGLYHSNDCYFYAEFNDVDYSQASLWIKENVIVHLEFKEVSHYKDTNGRMVKEKGSGREIKEALEKWLMQFDETEIWADVLAYDWVLFCDIFGGAMHIPKNIFYIPFDLSTLFKVKNYNPDLNRFEFVSHLLAGDEVSRHHALTDARVGKLCYDLIT